MKLPNILRPRHSIAGRLTLRVLLTIFAVFAAISALLFGIAWLVVTVLATENYQSILNLSNEKADKAFTSVEVAIANTIPEVESTLDHPDRLYDITRRILALNPHIVGSAIAFEPDYYVTKGEQFAPYSYRQGDDIKSKQLGTGTYRYRDMEWYRLPKEQGKACWSEPYLDEGGAGITMTTYSQPLYDQAGRLYAVITADMALGWITDMLHHIDSVNNNRDIIFADRGHAYSFIISRKGTYVAHPDGRLIMNGSFLDDCRKTAQAKDDSVAVRMLAGEKGWSMLDNNGRKDIVFYAPIDTGHNDWSMAVVVPAKDIFDGANSVGVFILILMGLGLLAVFFVCQHTIHRVTRPLTRFAHSADEIAQGHLDADLPVIDTNDEMQKLRTSFELMQASLISQIEQTRTVNEAKGRIESELRIARNIQMAMLPKTFPPYPDRKDIDIYARLTPAKEVGGDLYDFYIRDEKLFFCVGDVSGKGVPASLVMAVTRALFRTVSARESHPSKIVGSINDVMAADNESNMCVTLFVGVLDLPTGRLRYCNAGHCAPLLIGAGVGLLPIVPNLPSGVLPGFKYEGQETLVYPGTTIFLYTDGLTEAENGAHELYGESRMLEAARRLYAQSTYYVPQLLLENMTANVDAFVDGAEQSDDLTLMAIRYQQPRQTLRLERAITLPNDVATVPQLNTFVDGVAKEVGLDASLTMRLNLAIEEAVVNVMNYAYPQGLSTPRPRRMPTRRCRSTNAPSADWASTWCAS